MADTVFYSWQSDLPNATNITSARKMRTKSMPSGIQNAGVLEVAGDAGAPMIEGAHEALNPRAQLFLAVGQALLVDIALEVIVQVLVGIQLPGIMRQVEHLDPLLVGLQPVVHLRRIMGT